MLPNMRAAVRTQHRKAEQMTGRLTTHVLDTADGKPAAGLAIDLFRIEGERRTFLKSQVTNDDGRTEAPMLGADDFDTGTFELVFYVGDYFKAGGRTGGDPVFLDMVPVRFGISEKAQHYHVPLLVSPFAYSTYRGS